MGNLSILHYVSGHLGVSAFLVCQLDELVLIAMANMVKPTAALPKGDGTA